MKRLERIGTVGGLLLMISLPAIGKPRVAEETSFHYVLTGRVFNSAGIAVENLVEAEMEVGRLFKEAGIQVRWLNCSAPPDFIQEPDPCQPPPGSSDAMVMIRLAKGPVPAELRMRPNAMGLAVNTKAGGVFAFIFCSRVEDTAKGASLPFSRVLSCAMAHEMGHLLMGDRPHSSFGLMRGDWEPKDLRRMAMSPLSFLPQDSALMRSGLSNRIHLGEAKAIVAVEPAQ
jgi:hypothetical protein